MVAAVLAGIGALGSIAGAVGSYQQQVKANQMAKDQFDFSKQVYDDEKARVEKQDKERDEFNTSFNQSVKESFENSKLPTLRV
ncbi:hypothetical protein CQA49_08035 [Helicobacter sp. MIT 00-7814]|uniref:hypothetical protein n=1 Tax=unclassified Helicobacter TaxID=2593540 RepID=UPI000E1E7353|nr:MULTISPECIES: hypothetical protein [unclassified Helicobacter]RDU51875.1 hypothetical protein CQA37_09185 [Helicobacter sp. MIT 99-10781]RDU52554.1 hypothetical protein CQA49_08035 [Helicobacter sp. MIT 00-7814]